MANVVSFSEFENERDIEAYQSGLPRIVLEGVDDLRLFRTYWFPHLIDRFQFIEANEIVGGGGCTAVIAAVEASKQDNIPAFGFVDRDRLFRVKEWATLFDVDASAFTTAASNNDFYTTLRWEVEAYLLEPDLLSAWLRSFCQPPARPEQSASAVARAVYECEQLLKAHRYFATAHHCGVPVGDEHFLDRPISQLLSACDEALRRLNHDGTVAAAVDSYVDIIMKAAPADPGPRLVWLLQYVDTKRLLVRLTTRWRGNGDIRWFLAECMHQSNTRPQEIERKLLEVYDTLAA